MINPMKASHTITLLTIIFLAQLGYSQNLKFDWVKTMPVTSNYGELSMRGSDSDLNGGFYSIFTFQGSIDIDPTQDTSILTSIGYPDLIIQKIDTTGALKWAKQISGEPNRAVRGTNIKCDGDGNIYVIGEYSHSVDFNPDTGTFHLNSIGNSLDIFILKMDSLGNYIWAKSIGGPRTDRSNLLQIDQQNNIYISGTFQDSVNFNPGNPSNLIVAKGLEDAFILKLDPTGNLQWVNTYGNIQAIYCSGLQIDNQSNIIATGAYSFQTQFDPNDSTQVLGGNSQYNNLFVLKLDSAGNFVWVKGTPPSNDIVSNGVAIDHTGNIYVSGVFDQQANFDTATSSSLYTSEQMNQEQYDAFLLKLRPNGDFVWVKGFQGYGANGIYSPFFTPNNDLIIVGSYTHEIDVDPDTTQYFFNGDWRSKGFIEKLDSTGKFIWAYPFSSSNWYVQYPILLTQNQDLFLGGSFNGEVDFDPSVDSSIYNSQNGNNSFFLKLKACSNPSPITTAHVTTCNTYYWSNGITYSESTNQARQIFSNSSGCDSLVILDLTILKSGVSYDTITTCDSITWIDGNTYSQTSDSAAIVTMPYASQNGCDSLVILSLTNQSNQSVFNEDACNEYTWLNGITYYQNTNTPQMVYTNTYGCDSTVTLNLRLFPYDTNIIQTDSMTLFATYTQGLKYQWYNCDGDSIIDGQNKRSFRATQPGNYAVIFSRNFRCSDTSSCYFLGPLGLGYLPKSNLINVYPNPTQDFVNLEFQGTNSEPVDVLIVNNIGGIVFHQSLKISKQSNMIKIDVRNLIPGFYFIKVTVGSQEHLHKFSKI